MTKLTRRAFNAGLASLPLMGAGLRNAFADITDTLPNRYSGATLRVLAGAGTIFDRMASMDEEFTKVTGIKVEQTYLNYNELYQKIVLDSVARNPSFDLYYYTYQWKYEIADNLADLANVEQEVPGAPSLDLDDYPKRVLDIYGRVGDRLVGLPALGGFTLLIWNKALYEKAGFDPNTAPKTWAQVVDYGRKLTSGDQYGFALPAGKGIQCAVMWILLFKSMGGDYFDASGMPTFDSAASVNAIRFLVDELQSVAPPGNLTWDFPEMLTSFITEQSAQGMNWPGGFPALMDPAQSKVTNSLGFAPTPEATLLGGTSLGANAKSKNVDAAKLYIAWISSRDIQKRGALIGFNPTRISILSDPEAIAAEPSRPIILEGLQGNVAEYIPVKEAEQFNIMIYDEVNAAIAKIKSPEDAANDMQAKIVAFMKKRGYLQ